MARKYVEIPIILLNIEDEGFHIMIHGGINGKEAFFLIDTGASRSVFDPKTMESYIQNPDFKKKDGLSAGVGGSNLECTSFQIEKLSIGDLIIDNFQAVALDLKSIHDSYAMLKLPKIDGVIGGDVLSKHKATISYKLKKIKLLP
jgi:hypothetical protein